MSHEPLVSIVIPTRNRPSMLARAVESAITQNEARIEILIVDDGSETQLDPGSLPTDRRVRVIHNDTRRGASAARNRGLYSSRGALVAFLDDDDEWLPNKLAAQVGVLDNSGTDVVLISCAFRVVSDITGEQIRSARPPFDDSLGFLLESTPFPTSVPLIRREVLQSIGGFDEALEGAQDRDLWIRLRARGEFGFTTEVGVIKHNHDDQITTRLDLKRRALELFLQKHDALYRTHKSSWAHQLARLGLMHCAEGSRLRGALTLLQSALTNPRGEAWRVLSCQLFGGKRVREAQIERAFRQLDGALRYF